MGTVIAIELSVVAINVMLNQWNNRFYNALQERNWDAFIYEIGFFCVLAAIYIVLAVYQLYLNQWLQIRWRRWMTRHYLDHWLAGANHYRMQLLGDAADNPDQRIAEDINMFMPRSEPRSPILSAGRSSRSISASSGSRPTSVSTSFGCARTPSKSRCWEEKPPSGSGCSIASVMSSATFS